MGASGTGCLAGDGVLKEAGPANGVDALQLRVTRVEHIAEGVLGLTLAPLAGCYVPAWTPGAHIDLRLPSGAVRSYSLCGDPPSPFYRIAVSLEAEGRGASREIFETQLVGRIVSASAPSNDFPLVEAPEYLFIAGGIGITPILPMLRAVAEAGKPWLACYLGRSRSRLGFLDELTRLGRNQCRVLASDEGNRLRLDEVFAQVRPGAAVYCCGPNRLMDEAMSIHAASDGRFTLHLERFGRPDFEPDSADALAAPVPANDACFDAPCDPDGPFEVELRKTGVVLTVAPGETILGHARKVRTGLTYNCSSGYCGTCETRVLSGQPDHRDDVLSEEERRANTTVMICVSRSRTRRLAIDL